MENLMTSIPTTSILWHIDGDEKLALSAVVLVSALLLIVRFLSGSRLGSQRVSMYERELSEGTLKLPPVVPYLLPYFGSWFQLERDPQGFLKACQAKYGDYYTLYICGRNYHVVGDHRQHRFYYHTPDAHMRAEGSPFIAVLGGEDSGLFRGAAPSVLMADTARWLATFHKHVATGLQGGFLRQYVPYVREDAMGFLSKLMSKGKGWDHLHGLTSFVPGTRPEEIRVNMFEAIEEVAIKTNLRMMLDSSYLERYPHVIPLFHVVKQFFERWASHPIQKNIILLSPTPDNLRIRSAVKELKRTMLEHINRCYDEGESHTILLTALKKSSLEDIPGGPPRGILITIFLLLITATANAPLTCFWMLYHMAKSPRTYQAAREEQDQVRNGMRAAGLNPNNPQDWSMDCFRKMKYMDACILEAIRLYQGAFHVGNVLRGVFLDQVVDGKWLLPAGDLVALPTSRYLDPEVFPNPDQFIPERWLDPALQAQHREDPFLFSPFGHGVHMCPGRAFAQVFIKTIAGGVVSKLDMEIPEDTTFEAFNPPFTGIRPPLHGPNRNHVLLTARKTVEPI